MAIYTIHRTKHRIVIWHKGNRTDKIFEGPKSAAVDEEARLTLQVKANASTDPTSKLDDPSFLDFCLDRYAPYTRLHVQASTWSTRKHHVNNLIEFFHFKKNVRFSEFTTTLVDDYKVWRSKPRIVTKKRHGKEVQIRMDGAKGRTINNEQKTLVTMRSYARDHKIAVGDFKTREVPEQGKGRVPFWTPDQIAAIYRACEEDKRGLRLLPVLVFLINTGCRKGEAIHAERAWVNLERKNQGRRAPMLEIAPNAHWQPKNGEPREVPISDALLPFLKAKGESSKYIFTSTKGTPYKFFPNRTFRRIVRAAGLEGGPHMMRHSFASAFLAMEGTTMWMLSHALGQSHEKVTKLYAHMMPDHMEKARNKVNLAPSLGPAAVAAADRWNRKAGAR